MPTYNMTTNQPEEGAFLVYFNGVEIPSSGVSVSMGLGTYPTAEVTVAPDSGLIQLGAQDRVQVAIFYKDNHYTRVVGKAPDFRLIFDGEIIGWSYVTAAGERRMRFSCVAHAEVLDHLLPEFVTGVEGIALNAASAPETGAANSPLLQTELTFPWSLFFFGLNPTELVDDSKTAVDQDELKGFIRRPYDIIRNMLRAISGTEV